MMAMMDAAKYSVVEELRNGRRVEIRALRPDDRALAAPAPSPSFVVSSL
jgi:hypothetical protein